MRSKRNTAILPALSPIRINLSRFSRAVKLRFNTSTMKGKAITSIMRLGPLESNTGFSHRPCWGQFWHKLRVVATICQARATAPAEWVGAVGRGNSWIAGGSHILVECTFTKRGSVG